MNEYVQNEESRKNQSIRIDRKIIGKALLFTIGGVALLYILSVLLSDYLFTNSYYNNRISKMIYSGLFVINIIQIIGSLMVIYLLLASYKQTKYIGFLYEEIGFILFFLLSIIFLPFIVLDPFTYMYVVFLDFIPLIQYQSLKKPLICDYMKRRKLSNSSYSNKTDIIRSQASIINNFQDGYTTRSYFIDYSDVSNKITDSELEKEILNYAKFLALNGDLVSFDLQNQRVNLYLRTNLIQIHDVLNILGLYRKIKRYMKKVNLSTLTFDLQEKEISIKLSKDDYKLLDDVTYHELVERLLQQFKIGFENFIEKNYFNSYRQVVPDQISSNSLDRQQIALILFIISYLIGTVFIGSLYMFLSIKEFHIDLINSLYYFIGWPFVSYVGAGYIVDYLRTGVDSANYMSYFPLIAGAHILAILISLLVIVLLYLFKIRKTSFNGLKLDK